MVFNAINDKFVLVIKWFSMQLTINLTSGNKGGFKFPESLITSSQIYR